MRMIGRGHDDGIDLFVQFVQHPPEILKNFGFWVFFKCIGGIGMIHIA